jgi:hypothetical protein
VGPHGLWSLSSLRSLREIVRVPGTRHRGSRWIGMARDLAQAGRNTVRTGIGAELRTLHSDLLRTEIPDSMAELIRQLDQRVEAIPRGQDADDP